MDILNIIAQMLGSPGMAGPNGADRQPALPMGALRLPVPETGPIEAAGRFTPQSYDRPAAQNPGPVFDMAGRTAMPAPSTLDAAPRDTGYSTPPAQGDGFLSRVGQMFGGNSDRDDYNRQQMLRWIQEEGNLDPASAAMIASSPETLQRFVLDQSERRQKAGQPDWQAQTIYDDRGNEQRVLVDMNNPTRMHPMGGSKSSILSPEEEAQKVRLAQASRTQINNNMPGQTTETAYDKELGTNFAKRYVEIQQEANGAQRANNALTVMEQASRQPGFYSGTGAGAIQYAKRAMAALGYDEKGVTDMETFNAMSKQAALDLMGGSLGSGFSNADRQFVLDQVPNLSNSPEGNKQLIKVQRKLAGRKLEIAKLARNYAKKNGGRLDAGFDDHAAAWAESNPLFTDADRTSQQPWYRRGDEGPTRIRNTPQQQQRQRATNPQTGESVEWNGSQWVPVR